MPAVAKAIIHIRIGGTTILVGTHNTIEGVIGICPAPVDVDADVRAEESDLASIEKRDEAMTEKILGALVTAKSVLVIVGEAHRTGVSERLKKAGGAPELIHMEHHFQKLF